MTRWWDRAAGAVIDTFGLGLTVLLCVAAAGLTALAWHFWPRWLPRRSWWEAVRRWWSSVTGWRLPRWRRPGRRTRPTATAGPAVPAAVDDTLPDRPAAEFTSLADDLAAAGRYAEAVRERLRGMIRELVDAGVVSHHPDWTVTELARAAVTRRPETGPALDAACRIFSDIWYGQREALATHDTRMRRHAADLHAAIATPVPAR